MKMPSVEPPEVRSNGRPGDDEGCLWSGTLLRRGPSLLAHNEHLPCEMVLPKPPPPPIYTELPTTFIKKCPNCSQWQVRQRPAIEWMGFMLTWQGDWLLPILSVLIWINILVPYFLLCMLIEVSYVLRGWYFSLELLFFFSLCTWQRLLQMSPHCGRL